MLCAAVALAALAAEAGAAPLPVNEWERTCWLSYTRERTRVNREVTSVDFSNLKTGYAVASPFLVDFAVKGMGVVPAGLAQEGTGHHHILINTRLPSSTTEKIPFSDTHRHFGKGQTSALVDLPPGRHTLRLLFADHEHRPYFTFSREIAIEVKGARSNTQRPRIDPNNFEESCAQWYQDEVSRPRPPDEPLHFTNLRAGEPLVSPLNLRMGVDGFGICAKGQKAEKSGHFMLEVLNRADRRPLENVDLSNGATQTNLFVKPGNYIFKLRFVDSVRGEDLMQPHELPANVVSQERL